jgi:hypothetical protein
MGMNQKILAGLVHLMAIMFVTMIVINALGGAGYKGMFLLCQILSLNGFN